MTRKRAWLLIGAVAVAVGLSARLGCPSRALSAEAEAVVTNGEFCAWSVYEGTLDARRVVPVMSRLNGTATIIELAPEGTEVKQGDLLVRFDSSQIEGDMVKLEHDYTVAKAELDSLEQAELPMELLDLQTQLLEARFNYNSEKQYLDDTRELKKKDLVSDPEIAQQELKVQGLRSKLEQIENRMKLTTEHLHPSRVERIRANVATAEQQLTLARQQLSKCTIAAPSDGIVVYAPVPIATEFRAVRVGDTLYRNQPFMYIPDMKELIVRSYVPEAELSRVQPGMTATISPIAYPSLKIQGRVDSVGAMAQDRPGYPAWQKYFPMVMGLDQSDPRLRTGISMTISILSYRSEHAVLAPRLAVQWDRGNPWCTVLKGRRREIRPLTLGRLNEQFCEILSGLTPGERVLMP